MNIHSRGMARLIDESKMQRINSAATELIVEKGYGNASISAIAKRAGVAEGYLYRFHSSKEQMVNALLHSKIGAITDKLQTLFSTCNSVEKIMNELIGDLFIMAKNQPTDIKFLYVLMHDYNFSIDLEQRKIIVDSIQNILKIGRKNGEIGSLTQEEEVFNMAIHYPITFFNLRFKNFFERNQLTNEDQLRITEFCIKALNV